MILVGVILIAIALVLGVLNMFGLFVNTLRDSEFGIGFGIVGHLFIVLLAVVGFALLAVGLVVKFV